MDELTAVEKPEQMRDVSSQGVLDTIAWNVGLLGPAVMSGDQSECR